MIETETSRRDINLKTLRMYKGRRLMSMGKRHACEDETRYHEACVLAERNKETGFNIYKGPVVVQRLPRPKCARKEAKRLRTKQRRQDRQFKETQNEKKEDIPCEFHLGCTLACDSYESTDQQKKKRKEPWVPPKAVIKPSLMEHDEIKYRSDRAKRRLVFKWRMMELAHCFQNHTHRRLPLPVDMQQRQRQLEPLVLRLQNQRLKRELDLAKRCIVELNHTKEIQRDGWYRLKEMTYALAHKYSMLQRIRAFEPLFQRMLAHRENSMNSFHVVE